MAQPIASEHGWPEYLLPASLDSGPHSRCSFCGLEIQWGRTKNGKRCPYDIASPFVSHWATCPKRAQATARFKRPKKDQRLEIIKSDTLAYLKGLGFTVSQAKNLWGHVEKPVDVEDAVRQALRFV